MWGHPCRGVWCWQKHRERSEPCVSEADQYVQERVCEGASRDMCLHWMNHGCTDRWQQPQHRTDRKRKGQRWGSLVPYVVSSRAILLRTQHPGEILSFILLRFITWGQILADSLKWSIAYWFQETLPFAFSFFHSSQAWSELALSGNPGYLENNSNNTKHITDGSSSPLVLSRGASKGICW